MFSKNIKNWSYELSLEEKLQLSDIKKLLKEAVKFNSCFNCGGIKVKSCGLCSECIFNLTKPEKDCLERVVKEIK